MIIELDSSNIIAVLLNQDSEREFHLVKYKRIRDLALELEKRMPTLLTYSDMMSIDAFKSVFSDDIILEEYTLRVNNYNKLKNRLNCFLPNKKIIALIKELNTLLDETNS